ncbi:MAG: acetyl-CoA synthase subunit gamma [Deltaproteobacteria bacterium]|nr:acetyl-CoA synthase subunit gamma [Deltaproteobacteria bacterium]MBW2322761.1 acetyl-CoA synthase subunit gamma [Deltaproteobacteria bacterium]
MGTVQTPVGPVPQVSASLDFMDHWGVFKARWGVGRMNYTVEPGLYALGHPDSKTPVLVTANYKLTFDTLRRCLPDLDVWILVLNTEGINVWCAAGKGTFGTEELVRRIKSSRLEEVVSHRQVILPQLSGPGIAAYQISKLSGFKAVFGPITASDIKTFLDKGCKADPEMRQKTFSLSERTVLIPVELTGALKPSLLIIPLLFILGGLGNQAGYWDNALHFGVLAVIAFLGSLLAGAVLTPIFLPWLPGRAFSVKGLFAGLIVAAVFLLVQSIDLGVWSGRFYSLAWLLLIPGVSAFLAMNFTGASTYTSLSGVKKEMRYAVPLEGAAVLFGLALWIVSRYAA